LPGNSNHTNFTFTQFNSIEIHLVYLLHAYTVQTNLHLKLLGLGTHNFVKVPRPRDSEGQGPFSVFESSCHLLLPI